MICNDLSRSIWATSVNGAGLLLVEDVLQLEAQGVTCYSSTSLTLYSVIAQALIERGGPSIRAEAAKYRDVRVGDVIALPGGRLKSRYVLVAVTNTLRETPTLESIARCTVALLQRATGLGLESLAIPLIRVGRQLEQEAIVRATLAPVVDHLSGDTSLRQVYLGLQSNLNPLSARSLSGYLDGAIEELVALGSLRARIEGLQAIRQRLTLFEQRGPRLRTMLLRAELGLLRQIRELLEGKRGERRHGAAGLDPELQRCKEQIGSVERQLAPAERPPRRERALGE